MHACHLYCKDNRYHFLSLSLFRSAIYSTFDISEFLLLLPVGVTFHKQKELSSLDISQERGCVIYR